MALLRAYRKRHKNPATVFIPWTGSAGLDKVMDRLKRAIDLLVYASVLLGLLLLFAARGLVPSWLLYSLVVGEAAYAATAMAVARGYTWAYYLVIALALLVLAVSLPRPEHYAFATSGQLGDFLIFAAGSVLQICLLVMISVYMTRKPKT